MKIPKWPSRERVVTGTATQDDKIAAPTSGTQDLTLQDLTLLKVAMSWQEAVAILLELIATLTDRERFPSPAQVVLTEIGETRTSGARAVSGHSVRAAAALLGELLGSAVAPAELRSTIEQDIAAEPRHKTLEEFATALAYFERPGRRGDVAAVYSRAHALHAKAAADLELERLRARAAREQESATARPATPAPWRAKTVQVAVIAALSVVIAGGATALFTMAFAPPPARDDASVELEASTPTSQLAAAVTEAKRLASEGLAKAISAVTPEKDAPADPPAAPSRSARARRHSSTSSDVSGASANAEFAAAGTAGKNPPSVEMVVSAKDVAAAMPAGSAPRVVEVIEVFASEPEPGPAYTSLDDVQPATLVRPQLPSRLIDGTPAPEASVLDMIVDEVGRVEFVRLEGARSAVNEKMLVSAAKAWVFEPALREGRPVRYRMRVQISE